MLYWDYPKLKEWIQLWQHGQCSLVTRRVTYVKESIQMASYKV